ncbi:phosphoribosyl-AMP cyclohydrolase [Microbulbifer discodermiae]|uniref:phosphoribosyl-AMP cyclohydrolase n=1 Tax=Microbulbifer sp. 2201CG32-9 TaxID=3232309 RepID=UPI00345BFEAD
MTQVSANTDLIAQVSWDADGLVPAIAQEFQSGRVLMMAWMNRESLQLTIDEGQAVYWSRSRGKLWRKGESSGHVQRLRELRLDCDGDTLLLLVEQLGGIACHTGRASCFYRVLQDDGWQPVLPIIKDPEQIYE